MRHWNYKGEYNLAKAEYLSAKYYALRYNIWMEEYNSLKDSVGAIIPDNMPHAQNTGNPTESLAIRREALRKKMELVEQTAIEADPELYQWILKRAVHGVTYEYMNMNEELYCSKRTFYRRLTKFYYLLAKKI